MADLLVELARLRRQLWLERAERAARLGLLVGAGLLLLGELALRLAPANPPVPTLSLALVPLVSLAFGMTCVALRRPTPIEAARVADRRLGLREQLGTAVELAGQAAPAPLARAQIARAHVVAQQASQAATPATMRSLALVATCCGLALALAGLVAATDAGLTGWRLQARPAGTTDSPPRADLVAGRGVDASQVAAVGRLAPLMLPVSGAQPPTEEQLATVEQRLSQATSGSQAAQQSLARLAAALRQVSAGEPAAQALERGDYTAAVGSIVALGQDSDQLSTEARRELSAALLSAAQASAESPLLADRERRAAEALAFPSYAPTLGALQNLADATDHTSQAILSQSELSAAWQQLKNAARLSSPGDAQPAVGALAGQAQTGAAGTGTASAAVPPGDPSATRLDTAGVAVEVPLTASATRGTPSAAQPGAEPPDRLQVVAEPADARGDGAAGAAAQVARAERNSIPADLRGVVRDYFTGDSRSP